jgi:FADH2 O2-dependent halogenase
MSSPERFDVIILGSGLAGSTLAAILARHGQSVVMLEAGSHPRFAVGESVVPEFGALANILADRFDVPELAFLANFQRLRHHVSANSGIKRNFSFLQHADGKEPSAEDWSQFQTMTHPIGPDSHIYRPDVDAWLTALAVQYGAVHRERVSVAGPEDVELRPDGVRVNAGGRCYEGRFLVDGTGYRSVLAQKLGLRAETTCATNSRSLFTHMVGVRDVADVLPAGSPPSVPSPPDQGTLHHHFDGGWFWVIPFGNHSTAINPVCSIGLTLDRSRHPDNDRDAEEEFFSIAQRFPVVRRQLEGARAVRTWVKTGRLQYQSKQLVGPRWCLLPHSASFLDPLFSGGLVLTLLGVRQIAAALLEAVPADDPEPAGLARYQQNSLDNFAALDKVIHGSYVAFRTPGLFNAWYRIWATGNFHASAGTIALHLRYLSSGDARVLDVLDEAPFRRSLGTDDRHMQALLDAGHAILRRVESGELEGQDAKRELFELLERQADWIPPQFHIADRDRRDIASFTVFPLLSIIFWGKKHAPADMRAVYYDVGPVFFLELTKSLVNEGRRGLASFLRVARAAHMTRGRS